MSTIKLNGTTSGSSIIKAPDSGSTNQTFTLPAATGTLVDTSTTNALTTRVNIVGGRKNILINGGFDVWQRGTSFSHTSGKNFICDRWWVNPSSVGGTQTRQSAGLDGVNYALRMQRTSGQSGTGLVYLQTEMESANSMQFRGKKVTLSFYARKGANFSQSNSQITSNVATGTGTDQTLQTGFTGGANVISQNNTLTTSWQRFTHTTSSVLASTVNQIAVQFTHSPAGTAGAADYYEITGVQLEVGDTATDFEHRSYGEELALCQRYYYRKGEVARTTYGVGACHTSTSLNGVTVEFPVTMRANPTMSQYGTYTKCYITGSGQNQTTQNSAFGTEGLNPNSCGVSATGSSLTAGNAYWLNTVDAEHWLAWEAEL